MTLLETLRQDYQRFPEAQTYSLYAADVQFRDPLTEFRGLKRYQKMIRFIQTWFIQTKMELFEIQQVGNQIHTTWSLQWLAPLPWRPQMQVTGRSILTLNEAGLITSHVDEWDCSRWAVIQQLFSSSSQPS
jgi:Uncharacterized conserved protein (DUF2358)